MKRDKIKQLRQKTNTLCAMLEQQESLQKSLENFVSNDCSLRVRIAHKDYRLDIDDVELRRVFVSAINQILERTVAEHEHLASLLEPALAAMPEIEVDEDEDEDY